MSYEFTPEDFKQMRLALIAERGARVILGQEEPPKYKPTPQPKTTRNDGAKIAASLRKLADGMQKQIDTKFNSGISQQRPTARRARIADSMVAEGREMQKVQATLYALAEAHENGTIPAILSTIRYRKEVEEILRPWSKDERKEALEALVTTPQQDPKEAQIRKLERDLLNYKIPGFFPTPKALCERMVRLAKIGPNDEVLEPSAGKGNIAEVIRELHPTNTLKVIEWNQTLQQILKLKGFEIIGSDFLSSPESFDRIISNPPFEQFQDVEHVQHAYNLLAPGGRLVSIMGESVFFRQDAKAKEFRQWLDEVGGYSEKLPDGSFKESGTGVAARIVVIDR